MGRFRAWLVALALLVCIVAIWGNEIAIAQEIEALEPPQREVQEELSRFWWTIRLLGLRGLVLYLGSGVAAFCLSLLLVRKGNQEAGSALMLVVGMPIAVTLLLVCLEVISDTYVIADSQLRVSEVAAIVQASAALVVVGIFVTTPAFLVATVGMIARSLRPSRNS